MSMEDLIRVEKVFTPAVRPRFNADAITLAVRALTDDATAAREAKTAKLRTARLQYEAAEKAQKAAEPKKPAKKPAAKRKPAAS
ncbi:hypothetical protein [Frigidibacter mobilis]|uniref:Uncharacterized protein n=1 Tax=Frigidibacter mobilis TaxID=1335048 RepID=A0A165SH39_9RHOB|nr:hypothetical protein [Frigidibacter mobilis]AMY68009.1 hypothetical protein AKL17_0750 [Frigidibacter mobilis]